MLSVPLPTDRESIPPQQRLHLLQIDKPLLPGQRTNALAHDLMCDAKGRTIGLELVFLQERLNALLQLGIKLVVVHRKLHAPRPLGPYQPSPNFCRINEVNQLFAMPALPGTNPAAPFTHKARDS